MAKIQNKNPFLSGRGGRKPLTETEKLIRGAVDSIAAKEKAQRQSLSWQGANARGAGGHSYTVSQEPDGTYGARVSQSGSTAHLGYHSTKEAAQRAAEQHNLPYTQG